MKFLKYLFTVPKGKKVTENDMKRILASSVCGILLCMTCLFSTTWAWYTVSVESKPVSIQVAEHTAEVRSGDAVIDAAVELPANETKEVVVFFKTDAKPSKDSFKQFAAKRYIIADVHRTPEATEGETQTAAETEKYSQHVGRYYFLANKLQVTDAGEELYYETFILTTGADCRITFSTAWHIPADAQILNAFEGETVPEHFAFEVIPGAQDDQQTDSNEESQEQTPDTDENQEQTPDTEEDPQQTPVDNSQPTTAPSEPVENQASEPSESQAATTAPAETTLPKSE